MQSNKKSPLAPRHVLQLSYLDSQSRALTARQISEETGLNYRSLLIDLRYLTQKGFARRVLTGNGHEYVYTFVKWPVEKNKDGTPINQPLPKTKAWDLIKRMSDNEWPAKIAAHPIWEHVNDLTTELVSNVIRVQHGEKISQDELNDLAERFNKSIEVLASVTSNISRLLTTRELWNTNLIKDFVVDWKR